MQTVKELLGSIGVKEQGKIRCYADGRYVEALKGEKDVKVEVADGTLLLADFPAGTAFKLPVTDYEIDYSIAKYHTKVYFDGSILTYSRETKNPYGDRDGTWYIYCEEWMLRYLFRDEYLKNCGIERLYAPKHAFTKEEPFCDLDVKEGYDVYEFGFYVEGLEYPYYDIAVIRRKDDLINFSLFVMKSKTAKRDVMKTVVESFQEFKPVGQAQNYFDAGAPKENPRWSEETKEYFRSLMSANRVNWGVFSWSMPGLANELKAGDAGYDKFYDLSVRMEQAIEKAWGQPFDIYPTYTHIGKGTDSKNYAPHHFPLQMARALAGGNGKNGKPVLQFTYQFTLNNNIVGENMTPMFDILRGKYDEQFRRLARDIKAYEKPVLFRLNNEMNTDWTSYCGMVTLLDPDLFIKTWRRLYRIFDEEGVNNCMWIWNPIATSCPYSGWGEDLCYFPGTEFVQFLGGTSYEMNNYEKEKAEKEIVTFKSHYTKLYEKNKAAFSKYGLVISEFACGSGGDWSGELGRNTGVQAKWVRDMFAQLHQNPKPDWVKQIKGAIWFNCNDVADGKVTNRLRFIDPDGEVENETVKAFRECFRET